MAYGHRSPEYQEYINSAAWRKKAAACKERAGHRCQVCNAEGNLDAHHRTYERFKDEDPGDLTALCRECHDLYENAKRKSKPKPKKTTKAERRKAKKAKRQKKVKKPKVKTPPPPKKPHREDLRVEALNKKLRDNELRKAALEAAATRNAERLKERADRLDAERRQAEALEALPV